MYLQDSAEAARFIYSVLITFVTIIVQQVMQQVFSAITEFVIINGDDCF